MEPKLELNKPIVDYIQRKIVSIDENENVVDAAKLMQENQIGSLIVTRKAEPVGIVTERDILYKVVSLNRDPNNTKLSMIMSSPIKTIDESSKVGDAIALMSRGKMRRLAVTKDGKIIGIVSQRSIIPEARSEQVPLPELERPQLKRCPYCDQVVKNAEELSKHIDYVHIGKGLLQGDVRRWE